MRAGSLFTGIGGLDLGLERAGMSVAWQCEIDTAASRVLAQHWPSVRRFRDVRDVDATADRVDVIAGGFPCQDLSSANTRGRERLRGARSGLWGEFARVARELRPSWVIVENVGNVWRDWVPVVRSDLARDGYASVPMALSTAELGAPHHRDRVFVLAHANSEGECLRAVDATMARVRANAGRLGPAVWRACASALARVDGLPARLARLPGNAVAVYVGEAIGHGVMEASDGR